MSLIELLVSIAIFGIVALMVSTLLVNGFFMQQRVVNTTVTTGDAQTAVSAMTDDIRYSAAIDVTAGGMILRTRTWVGSGGSGSYVCRGWFYDDSDHVLRRTMDPAQTAAATTGSASSWPVYADAVHATTPFHLVDSESVAINFTVEAAMRGLPTEIDTTVRQRPQSDDGSSPCF